MGYPYVVYLDSGVAHPEQSTRLVTQAFIAYEYEIPCDEDY
jgi:hypothetical protein